MEQSIQHVILLPRSAKACKRGRERGVFSWGCLTLPLNAFLLIIVAVAMVFSATPGAEIVWTIGIVAAICEVPCAILLVRSLLRFKPEDGQRPFVCLAEDANSRFAIFNRTADVLSAYARNVSSGIIRSSPAEDAMMSDLIAEGEALRAYAIRLEKLFTDEGVSPLISRRIISEYTRDLNEIERGPGAHWKKLPDDIVCASTHLTNG